MENTEIINELANAIAQIVDKKVEEKTSNNGEFDKDGFLEKIRNTEFDSSFVYDLFEAIRFGYTDVVDNSFNDYAEEKGYVNKDDIDASWCRDELDNSELRDIALDYINDNL